jgi:release factor glutamine methyltransferase
MTLHTAIAEASTQITRRDAETLLAHLLAHDRAWVFAHPEAELDSDQIEAFRELTARRAAHEPLQYLTGLQEFYGLPLRVTPDTLIPRPETELLVEAVLTRVPHDRPVTILDIGTGSGAIAIALAHNLSQAVVHASDISPAALEIAHQNAMLNQVEVHFHRSDLLDELPGIPFDVIVSPPPYIPSTDRPILHPQVRDYEPTNALFAGSDGLDIYRRLIPQAFQALTPNGLLAMEIGHGQQLAIAKLLEGWNNVAFLDDLNHIPRVALARRP